MAWLDGLYGDARLSCDRCVGRRASQAPAGVSAPDRLRRVWTEQPTGPSRAPYVSDELSYHTFRAVAPALADQIQLALYALRPHLEVGRNADATVTVRTSRPTTSPCSGPGCFEVESSPSPRPTSIRR